MKTFLSRRILKRNLGGTFPFVVAFTLVCFATLSRAPFQKVLGDASPFLFYWPCVLLVAALFGLWPALLATGLAALQADYFWMPPQGVFNLNKVQSLQVLNQSQPLVEHLLLLSARGKQHRVRATLSRMVDATGESAGSVLVLQNQQPLDPCAGSFDASGAPSPVTA